MPIGAVLTFPVGLGVFGLWWGMVIGIYLACIIGLLLLNRVDWHKEARKTLKRLSTIVSTRQLNGSRPIAESGGEDEHGGAGVIFEPPDS